jgi:hypothetical protein
MAFHLHALIVCSLSTNHSSAAPLVRSSDAARCAYEDDSRDNEKGDLSQFVALDCHCLSVNGYEVQGAKSPVLDGALRARRYEGARLFDFMLCMLRRRI